MVFFFSTIIVVQNSSDESEKAAPLDISFYNPAFACVRDWEKHDHVTSQNITTSYGSTVLLYKPAACWVFFLFLSSSRIQFSVYIVYNGKDSSSSLFQLQLIIRKRFRCMLRGILLRAIQSFLFLSMLYPKSLALTTASRRVLLRYRAHLLRMSSNTASGAPSDRLFPEEINILYDSKCNVCRWEMEWLRRRDREVVNADAPKIKLTDLESPSFDASDPANGGVDYVKGMKSMTAVTADGKVLQGVPVFRIAYEQVGLGWLFRITQWPVMNIIFDFGYNIFARYRTLFTRGTRLDTLIQAYEEKMSLEAKKADDDCETCKT